MQKWDYSERFEDHVTAESFRVPFLKVSVIC